MNILIFLKCALYNAYVWVGCGLFSGGVYLTFQLHTVYPNNLMTTYSAIAGICILVFSGSWILWETQFGYLTYKAFKEAQNDISHGYRLIEQYTYSEELGQNLAKEEFSKRSQQTRP